MIFLIFGRWIKGNEPPKARRKGKGLRKFGGQILTVEGEENGKRRGGGSSFVGRGSNRASEGQAQGG